MLDKQARNLQVLSDFLTRHSSKFPEELSMYFQVDGCSVSIHMHSEAERAAALAIVGEVFGRSDWQAELDYRGKFYDWDKEIDGVRVRIVSAQGTGVKEKFPVNPKLFPLQLSEVAS